MRTIKLVLILALFFSFQADAQKWLWGVQGIPSVKKNFYVPGTTHITLDKKNNIYALSNCLNSIKYGKFTLSGGSNYYATIVKYDKSGNVIWAKKSSGSGLCYAYGIVSDDIGNTYITGQFEDTVLFGSIKIISPSGNFFIAKYDSAGNALWVRQSTGYSNAYGVTVTIDGFGNIYATGIFGNLQDTAFVAPYAFTTVGYGSSNSFILKYNSAGGLIWGTQPIQNDNSFNDGIDAMVTDRFGDLFITGSFYDSIAFGAYKLGSKAGTYGLVTFIAKYDSVGNAKWAKEVDYSVTASSEGMGIADDSVGNVYITGFFQDTLIFGKDTIKGMGPFLAKYSSSGNIIWGENPIAYNNAFFMGYGLTSDANCDVYLNAGINSSLMYNDTVVIAKDTTVLKDANDPGVIIKLDSTGKVLCSSLYRSGGFFGNIISNASGSFVLISGVLSDTVVFGTDYLGPIDTNNVEYPFVACWEPCGTSTQGVNNITKPNQNVILFPNPNNGIFELKIKNYESGMKSTVDIYNVLGEKIYEEALRKAQGDNKIDISNQSVGLYLYRLLNEEGTLISSGKFVIQH